MGNSKSSLLEAEAVAEIVKKSIEVWHTNESMRDDSYVIVTEEIRKIRPLNAHRNDLKQIITDLVNTNAEMWHEEDKVRSENDSVVLKAIRNINPLNQHRNDLIEEIDEAVLEKINGEGA